MGVAERRERERQARRGAVLDATRTLIRQRGFAGTTTKQIAERCELSEATVFWYFQSKDEIVVSLLEESIEAIRQELQKVSRMKKPLSAKLLRLWRFFSKLHRNYPEYFYVFAYLSQPESAAAVSDVLKAEIARRSGENFEIFAQLFINGTDHRVSRLVVDLFWGAFLGLIILRDSRNNLGIKPHPTERDLEDIFQLLLEGITARHPKRKEP